jgi:hypothetical protein
MPPHVHTDFVVPLLVVADVQPTSDFGAHIGRIYVASMMSVMICMGVVYQEMP